jgi:thiol-disulfide isomerase/thioredoxin
MSSVTTGAVLRSALAGALSAFVVACSSAATTAPTAGPVSSGTPIAATVAPPAAATSSESAAAPAGPAWLAVELTEATSGEKFTIGDFAGKVVLLENMAQWCPTCRQQGDEVKKLHQTLGPDSGLVSVSIDVDPNETVGDLRKYVVAQGFDWRFAVAPRELGAAFTDLYGPNFLNPPSAPMLIVDKTGGIHLLDGGLKSAGRLQEVVAPFLAA